MSTNGHTTEHGQQAHAYRPTDDWSRPKRRHGNPKQDWDVLIQSEARTMRFTDFGPGDDATWGPRTFHPLDPRNDPDDYPEDCEEEEEEDFETTQTEWDE